MARGSLPLAIPSGSGWRTTSNRRRRPNVTTHRADGASRPDHRTRRDVRALSQGHGDVALGGPFPRWIRAAEDWGVLPRRKGVLLVDPKPVRSAMSLLDEMLELLDGEPKWHDGEIVDSG